MKKFIPYLFLLLTIVSFSFCKIQECTPTDYPKQQIIFGSGGGITGSVTEYVLLENGAIFSKQGIQGEFKTLLKADKAITSQLFNNIDFLELKDVQVNQHGNRYHYVTLKNNSEEHQIMWGNSEAIPNKVKTFYDILCHLANTEH